MASRITSCRWEHIMRICWTGGLMLILAISPAQPAEGPTKGSLEPAHLPRVAGITTAFHHNSHAEMILGRMLQTDTLDGKGRWPSVKLVSLFTDQVPENDISRRLAHERGVPIYPDVAQVLTLGSGKLAVDGVFLVAEFGQVPQV